MNEAKQSPDMTVNGEYGNLLSLRKKYDGFVRSFQPVVHSKIQEHEKKKASSLIELERLIPHFSSFGYFLPASCGSWSKDQTGKE
jgi:hypothetical protein